MSAGDDGLLGNLPRTRPGTRSAKRGAPPRRPATRPSGPEPEGPEPTDPMGEVLRAAAGAAEAGARIAQDVAREVLRRLPRP